MIRMTISCQLPPNHPVAKVNQITRLCRAKVPSRKTEWYIRLKSLPIYDII